MSWKEMFYYAKENPKIFHPADATPHIAAKIMNKKTEQFVVVTLDGAHRVIKSHIVSIGTVNKTIVHPREVFLPAIKDMAVAIIVGHNHPSGNKEQSHEDIEVAKRLKSAGEIIGIQVLDHIIVTKYGYNSFLENNLL